MLMVVITVTSGLITLSANTWYHIAIVRTGTTTKDLTTVLKEDLVPTLATMVQNR